MKTKPDSRGNVQVLKGPQGTLFGIANNGGAMIIEPKRPTDRFEGYVQARSAITTAPPAKQSPMCR